MPGGSFPNQEPLFLDSVHLIALFAPDDNWRGAAIAASLEIGSQQTLYTSDGVLLEMLARFSRTPRSFRQRLVNRIREIRTDPKYRVVPHAPALVEAALELYAGEFADSSFSLQDCVAVVVMREYGIGSILTADQEFARARFTPLLRRYVE